MKSGSTWWIHLVNELLSTHGGADTAEVRRRWRLQRVISSGEFRFGALRPHRLAAVAPAAVCSPTFAVKTHAPATRSFKLLLRTGLFGSTFNVRDPRDLCVSVLDHAQRRRATGAIAKVTSMDDAIDFVVDQGAVFQTWPSDSITVVQYEQLVEDPAQQLRRVCEIIDLDVDQLDLERVVDVVGAAIASGDTSAKLNSAVVGRHRDAMRAAELRRAERLLRPVAEAMGYTF